MTRSCASALGAVIPFDAPSLFIAHPFNDRMNMIFIGDGLTAAFKQTTPTPSPNTVPLELLSKFLPNHLMILSF